MTMRPENPALISDPVGEPNVGDSPPPKTPSSKRWTRFILPTYTTLFILYTVVTGFFGQNFGWLVDNIDTKKDFLIYGVGSITIPTVILLTVFWVKRRDWF